VQGGSQRIEGLRKNEQNGSVLATSLWYVEEGEDMLNRTVSGMNHGCITTNPNQNVLQCNGNIPVHLQPKRSEFKVMRTIFWDNQGVLLAHFQKPGENVNSAL
jgi:hypothetical protein